MPGLVASRPVLAAQNSAAPAGARHQGRCRLVADVPRPGHADLGLPVDGVVSEGFERPPVGPWCCR